jgi:hypothetical protein
MYAERPRPPARVDGFLQSTSLAFTRAHDASERTMRVVGAAGG